jgi:hypothetical protein
LQVIKARVCDCVCRDALLTCAAQPLDIYDCKVMFLSASASDYLPEADAFAYYMIAVRRLRYLLKMGRVFCV